ncbi:MAG: hypothetical protein AAGF73_05065 [Actinomycetota bacterium]
MRDRSIPRPVFIVMADAVAGERYVDAYTPPEAADTAAGIADPDQVLHRMFEVPRGGWREMFGLRSWAAGIRATLRGKTVGAKVGDGWTLPTWVVLDDAEMTWRWVGTHAGDRPDLGDVPRSRAA